MKFAKAVFCPGVDRWYVRFGPLHGIDPMIHHPSGPQAKITADLINKTLTRELKTRGYKIRHENRKSRNH